MKVTFYHNKSNNDKVVKIIEQIKEIDSFKLKENTSIINPVILMKKDTDILTSNYCKIEIDNFTRYYYIDNIILENGGLQSIYLSIDVLMSHKDAILLSSAYIERCESAVAFDKYLNDAFFPIQTKRDVTVTVGDGSNTLHSFDTTCHNYLVVTGGGQSE